MTSDRLREEVKDLIRTHMADGQPKGYDPEALLKRVDELFSQYAGEGDLTPPPNAQNIYGVPAGSELDDYDHETPASEDTPEEAEDMVAGTFTEVGLHTPSAFGGSVAHAGSDRYGGARPAVMGPYGGPGDERGFEKEKEPLGDPTDIGDRRFANLQQARADRWHDETDQEEVES